MTGNYRKILLWGLILVIIFCGWRYMIKPANEGLKNQRQDVKTKLLKLAKLQKTTSATKDLETQLGELQNAIETLENKLPPTSQIGKVLEQVTLIAQNQGLRLKSIRTCQKKDNNGYIEQPLKLQVEGNFNSFYSFLLELEKLSRIMKIRHLTLEKYSNNTTGYHEGYVVGNFIVSVFFQNL